MNVQGFPASLDELIDYTKSQHPGSGALDHLADAVLVADHLGEVADHLVGHFVDQARRAGASWTEIGHAMGVSKQAAQKRFVPRPDEIGADKGIYDRLTNRARWIVGLSEDGARRTGHAQVGSLHVVLALVTEREGLAALAIQAQGAVLDELRQTADEQVGSRADVVPDQVPFGAEAKKIMQIALREAMRLGHNYIGTEHILLGMLRADETPGARLLAEAGVTHRQSEDWILAALEGYKRARK
jgi:hypothetical protein